MVNSTLERLQCLWYCLISLRLNYSATRWDFGFTLTHKKVNESTFSFWKYIMCHMSMRTVTPLLHLAEFQVTTTHIRLSYELHQLLIIRPIPYRVNYSLHFSNFQIVKKHLYRIWYINIYMYIFSNTIFF